MQQCCTPTKEGRRRGNREQGQLLRLFFGSQAIVADAAHFGARDSNLDTAVACDLVFQLIVEMTLEFADFSAAEAGDVDMIARAVGFVVVTIAAEMEEVKFVDEALFLEEIDSAIDGDEMDFVADFLGAFENLIDIEMLFGVVHDLENHAALTGEANAALTESLLKMAGGVGGIDAFAGRHSM